MKIKKIHFIGIGGIGMSSLAFFLNKKFKNINQTLLDGLNEEQKQIYLIVYDSTISSPVKFFCISGGACSIVTITILLANPALFLPRF